MTFRVIDPRTGNEPIYDGNHIGKEKWFRESRWNIIMVDEWIITENGSLGLMDRCGQVIYPPHDRFQVIFEPDETKPVHVEETVGGFKLDFFKCGNCGISLAKTDNYCWCCGKKVGWDEKDVL